MNKKVKINLNGIDDIKKFIQIARKFDSDIDIKTDRAHVDGKSIMALFALDLTQDTYVEIISDDIMEIRVFCEKMEAFR